MNSTLPKSEISTQVANNLAEWGYKIKADKTLDYSHVLSFEIGEIKQAATPAGFSFNLGNSNPRSVDFQKTDVLPMTCFITEKNQSEKSAKLDASVMANDYLPYAKQSSPDKKLISILTNDISTICFNLLSHLKIKTQVYEKNLYSAKPGWFPDIRVEVINDAEPELELKKTEKTNIDSDSETKLKTNTNLKGTESTSNIKIEVKQNKKQPRKRIIIHNQGSPVTIKFGYERR
ncbi:MAG: hypothetical protein HFP81_05265 [Methylococcales symbiont of Hymedesmia sp. n. MRB-2018]|nr:MAG: hypothetical protein HFP78_05345 [Methylococcales symbiont of Hymedesmia sp. n. MRB-2018]KAF3983834.1 MAG: hypothetical protein HFP81_05265 [Methylococcales symbiont of Hymedesmia sp. n. MRB-2018]